MSHPMHSMSGSGAGSGTRAGAGWSACGVALETSTSGAQIRITVRRLSRNSRAIRDLGHPSLNLARTASASAPSTRFAGVLLGTR